MNENTFQPAQPDDAFDRVRGADPAAGVEPDRVTLDAAVRARLADPGDDLAAVRARRGRSRWMAVAAVAAGALVFSTAGYAVGNRGGQTSTAAGAAITLGQQGTGRQGTTFGAPALSGADPEAATDSGAKAPVPSGASDRMSSSMIAPWYGGRTVFTASGLSDEAGTSQAWAYDPARVFSADTANRLAKALGLAGTATLVDDSWTVGPVDGSGPQLQLQPDGLASVSYYDPALDPYGCPTTPAPEGTEPGVDLQGSDSTSSDGSVSSGSTGTGSGSGSTEPSGGGDKPVPAPACTTKPAGAAPQGAAAVAKAKDLMRSLGLDADTFEYEAQDSGMKQSSYVSVYEVVGGERSGSTWNIGFVGDGVQSLYGSLAPVSSLGSYDLVSPKDAVARLTDPRFGPSYSGWPMPYAAAEKRAIVDDMPMTTQQGAAGATADIAPVPSRTVPPTVKAGSAIVWPVTEVTLTTSRLGLTMYTLPDGATVLLPAYELSGGGDGQRWSVVAVTDDHLDFTAAK